MNHKAAMKVMLVATVFLFVLLEPGSICQASTQPITSLPAPKLSTPVLGEQRIIVILADFQDTKHVLSQEYFHDLVFNELDSYIREASYDRVWLTGDVVGWHNLPINSTDYRLYRPYIYEEVRPLARYIIRTVDKDIDFSKYDYVFIFVSGSGGMSSSNWGGILGRTHARQNLLHASTDDGVEVSEGILCLEGPDLLYLVHLFGHCIGLPDLCVSTKPQLGGLHIPFFGRWDPMAFAIVWGRFGHFCAGNKLKLGWMPEENIRVVEVSETETVLVDPLSLKSNGIQVIKIPIGEHKYYLVEARRRAGFDQRLPNEGVLISWMDETKTSRRDWAETLDVDVSSLPEHIPRLLPTGIWKLVDAHPNTSYISDTGYQSDDAVFKLGEGYIDEVNNLAIVVTHEVGKSYEVVVTTAAKGQILLDEMEQCKKEAELVIGAAQDAVELARKEFRTAELDKAETLLDGALSNYQSGNYEQTVALASEARSTAERATKPQAYYDAQNLIEEAEQEIQQAEAREFHSQDALLFLAQATDEYGKACIAFTKNDFEAAKLHAEKALSLVNEALDAEKAHVADEAHQNRQWLSTINIAAVAVIILAIPLVFWWRRRHSAAK